MSPEAMQKMIHFQWKGNVRELENVIERAATLGRGPVMEEHIIDECLQRGIPYKVPMSTEIPAGVLIWRNPYGDERNFILKALDMTGGVKKMQQISLGLT